MRAAPVALGILLLAGCTHAPAAPSVPGASFAHYADCGWTNETTAHAGTCDDPTTSDRYARTDWSPDVPSGWTCRVSDDLVVPRGPPHWSLYTRPPPDDPLGPLSGRLEVGFGYEVNGTAYPVAGVFQMFSHPQEKILRWDGTGTTGFLPVGVFNDSDEVEFDGVVVRAPVVAGNVTTPPTARDDMVYPPIAVLDARNATASWVGTAWGRYSRLPQEHWYPRLFATQVVQVDGAVRYLPAFEFPITGGTDPKTEEGSGHWGSTFQEGSIWTSVRDGNRTLRIEQGMDLRFDGHFRRLDQMPGCKVCPLVQPADPVAGIRCALP